jgi:hypothetical protein
MTDPRRTSSSAFFGTLAGMAAAAVVIASPGANARATYNSPYGYERTWNAAMRLIRVDNGWKVVEKDESSGYLLFEYRSPESARPSPGSFELVRGREGNTVNVLVQLPQMPHYHEQLLLDSLAAKMRREYGDPPVTRPAPPLSPDAGDE